MAKTRSSADNIRTKKPSTPPTKSPDPAAGSHRIMSPAAVAVGMPLPTVAVSVAMGVGYIEGGGTNTSTYRILKVAAKVFRNKTFVPKDPTTILDTCVTCKPDPTGMIYQFTKTSGMIPGAVGGGSMENFLATWACFENDSSTWIQSSNIVQFCGQ